MIVTDDGFIKVDITDDMFERAQQKANELGQLRNSIRSGAGNIVGFLGEEVVLRAWPSSAASSNTYQHDIIFEDATFEVKSKDRTAPPRLDYEASVAGYNTKQAADFYVFVSLLRKGTTYQTGYVLGIIEKQAYFKKATYLRAGEIDPSNNWKVSANCYNLKYSGLERFHAWKETLATL